MELGGELRGKRAICAHVKRSWKTLQGLAEKEGFPLVLVAGIWVSDAGEIRAWQLKRLRRRSE
jgi:hypothetical protein